MPMTPRLQSATKRAINTKHSRSRSAMIEFLRRLIPPPSPNAWYKRRQRIARHLEIISGGKLILLDNACRSDGRLHIQHADCECNFFASLQDIKRTGIQHICPYCNIQTLDDVARFGSAQAVREYVEILTLDCLEFMPDNALGSSASEYEWRCLLHGGYRFTGSFDAFANSPHDFCPICRHEYKSWPSR